jgi:hypothetical protein
MQKITFTTNTGNNTLEYVKLLMHSLQTNLDSDEHQIIVFIDADNDGTLEYLQQIKPQFKDLLIINNELGAPVGYQRNKTLLTDFAKHDIVSYLQSDMVIGPHYDTEVLRHAKRGRILSSTRVEPPLHGESSVTFTKNFGLVPEEFNFAEWNLYSPTVKRDELISYFFAPITYYKEDWMKLGGYDTMFRRAREDSDFVQRCLHANIELVQTFSANVYHFTCVSSRGTNWFDTSNFVAQQRVQLQLQADNIELRRFVRKWGTFNHGESKLFKLDVDLVVKNYNLDMVSALEPFFSRVWVSNNSDRDALVLRGNTEQQIANTLLDFPTKLWEERKNLFRLDEYHNIYYVGEPTDCHILVTIDFNHVHQNNPLLANIQNLYDMLKDNDSGEYELDNILVSIRDIKVLDTPVYADNPIFDYSLLKVY